MNNHMPDTVEFAKKIRLNTMRCIHSQGNGHIGGSLSVADVLAVLYGKFMNIDPQNPHKVDRDRLVLSKGHSGPALYATLALLGYFPKEWLLTLNKLGTKLPSHCHMGLTPGVDMTAGSLGQGLSAACGFALASRLKNDNAHIYCIVGDGELQEGQNWEAAMFAGSKNLSNLMVFVDNNKMQIDGLTRDIIDVENIEQKFQAFKFETFRIDGHDHIQIAKTIEKAYMSQKPCAIVLETVKGKGVTFFETMGVGVHSTNVNDGQMEQIVKMLEGVN